MKRRVTSLTLSMLFMVSACGGSATIESAAGVTSTNGALSQVDPTPIEAGVDYTRMADFSAYDNWVCDNDTILDPVTGAILTPSSTISENPGALLRTVSGNGLPDHLIGDFPNPGNPNSVDVFPVSYRLAMRVETENPDKSTPNSAPIVGVSLGGIHMDPMTAEVYNNDRQSGWNYEALTIGAAANAGLAGAIGYLGTDCNNAHVQPGGKYHYHGMPEELLSDLLNAAGRDSTDPDMVMIGFAADGYPIYARYGYVDPMNASSGVTILEGSYELKSGTRPSGPGGSYDGTFTNDWEYVEGSGHLDQCNGRYGVTPEHPNGIYYYLVTDDYPFFPRCVWGTPSSDAFHGAP